MHRRPRNGGAPQRLHVVSEVGDAGVVGAIRQRARVEYSQFNEFVSTAFGSQDQQMLCRSLPDRGQRNTGIKSNEPSFMLNRESKQVYAGQSPRSMNSGRVDDVRIQQTDFIPPEFMDILAAGLG